jgi:hypothetical protein
MTRTVKKASAFAAVLMGGVALTRAFYEWPGLLPPYARDLGNVLINAAGTDSAETSADLELLYLLALSTGMVALLVSGVRWVINRVRQE